MKTIAIEYRFTLADGSRNLSELDAQTLELRVEWPGKLPLWTDLTFYQCPHCHVTTPNSRIARWQQISPILSCVLII